MVSVLFVRNCPTIFQSGCSVLQGLTDKVSLHLCTIGSVNISLFLVYFIDYVTTVVPILPLFFHLPSTALPSRNPALSSCPWVVHINSLASPFPILFLTFPCLFCSYRLCFLFHIPLPLPTNNPPNDLHFCDSVPVLVACLLF